MINLQTLTARAELLRRTRHFFDRHGFSEVQPPCLSRDCVVDAYLDPISIPTDRLGVSDTRLSANYFLQTSPESAMKRLLAAGAPSIYSLGPVFRGGELGDHHNLEFTMLEWYEVNGDYESALQLTAEYVCEMLAVDQVGRVSYRDAFLNAVAIDPLEASDGEVIALAEQLLPDWSPTSAGRSHADRDDALDIILSQKVSATLGAKHPQLLIDYPLSQAALAKPSGNDPRCACRFELFVGGVELANGYDELLDADELQERYRINNEKRVAVGKSPLAIETSLIAAMRQGLPPCSGVALGFDRLMMVMTESPALSDVIPLPFWEA
ncbi:EF-P lysine aminoacylase EpmA [Roseiconus lacunae]|uniref:EF-P lysine aminoacylase EpmA n=1 Tax=Roseiconus lacunae TaxID=2605694 RepID=UPI0011F10495|nr:EF-P lysine aminoacylase EpmA [Roseiconus lacunae]WRQ48506.1 EF-P lysine aminoacylase EpmA [Stieleria sp. HD01]